MKFSFSKFYLTESSHTLKSTKEKYTLDISNLEELYNRTKRFSTSIYNDIDYRLKFLFQHDEYEEYKDLYDKRFKMYVDVVNRVLSLINSKVSGLYYEQRQLDKHSLYGDISTEDDFYPLIIYLSGSPDDDMTIGVAVEKNGDIKMFEGNDESNPETYQKINELIGANKEVKIYASHNETLVNKIAKEKKLPKNLYISPDKQYAKTYWDIKEQRVLFSGTINTKHVNQEGDLDWKTIDETPIKEVKILGFV